MTLDAKYKALEAIKQGRSFDDLNRRDRRKFQRTLTKLGMWDAGEIVWRDEQEELRRNRALTLP